METRVLAQEHIAELLRTFGRDLVMDRVIDRLGEALAAGGVEPALTPPRAGFARAGDSGVLEWMPHRDPGKAVTIKTVSYTPTNPEQHGLPTILGTLTRFDDSTGRLTAIADGVLATAVRTGAASAVASGLLARRDSRVLGMIGAGAQAVTQAHALSRVLPLERVLVYDVDPARCASLTDRLAFTGLEVRPAGREEVAAAADVICTATSVAVGAGPVLDGSGLAEHVHINAVGADLPGKTELPVALLRSALVVADHPAQALQEGECQQLAADDIGPELAYVCAHPEAFAYAREQTTVFDSTGFALEDHLVLDVLLQFADEAGLGWSARIEHLPTDALDPYAFTRSAVPATALK